MISIEVKLNSNELQEVIEGKDCLHKSLTLNNKVIGFFELSIENLIEEDYKVNTDYRKFRLSLYSNKKLPKVCMDYFIVTNKDSVNDLLNNKFTLFNPQTSETFIVKFSIVEFMNCF